MEYNNGVIAFSHVFCFYLPRYSLISFLIPSQIRVAASLKTRLNNVVFSVCASCAYSFQRSSGKSKEDMLCVFWLVDICSTNDCCKIIYGIRTREIFFFRSLYLAQNTEVLKTFSELLFFLIDKVFCNYGSRKYWTKFCCPFCTKVLLFFASHLVYFQEKPHFFHWREVLAGKKKRAFFFLVKKIWIQSVKFYLLENVT